MEGTTEKPVVGTEEMDTVPFGYKAFLKEPVMPVGMWGTGET